MPLNKSIGNMYDFITHTWNTIKGEQTDKEAYNYCKEHTTPELAEKLQEWIKT